MTVRNEEKLRLKRTAGRESVLPWIFCSTLLTSAILSLYQFIDSFGQLQNTYFFGGINSGDTFADFFNVLKYIAWRDPYNNLDLHGLTEKAYPPLAYVLLYPFSRVADYRSHVPSELQFKQIGLMSITFFLLIACVPAAILIYNKVQGTVFLKSAVLAALLSSGVFLFAAERGNTILLAFLFTLGFLFGYDSENKAVREVSYLCLAAAAGLKIYPLFFGVLILKNKRYFGALRAALYGAALFFLPFLFFKGGFANFSQLLSNVSLNSEFYQLMPATYRFGILPAYLSFSVTTDAYPFWITVSEVTLAVAVLLSFFFTKKWKTAALIACVIIATPVNSAYYCGLYLIGPIVLFLNERKRSLLDWVYMVLFFIILCPYQFLDPLLVPMTARIANLALLSVLVLLLLESLIEAVLFLRSRLSAESAVLSDRPAKETQDPA